MPRFYFFIQDGRDIHDDEGVDFADLTAARIEAVALAGELLRDRPAAFWETRAWTMTVADENQTVLFTIEVAASPAPAAVLQFRRGNGGG